MEVENKTSIIDYTEHTFLLIGGDFCKQDIYIIKSGLLGVEGGIGCQGTYGPILSEQVN